MVEGFVKFPRTPHLFWEGESIPRGDKLLDAAEASALLRRPVSVEEKVDGANVGLSLGPDGRLRAQNRGAYLEQGTAGQWKPLWRWLALHEPQIAPALSASLILFGEWCYAEHSIPYDALPDWMLVIDVYDRSADRFWSRDRRDVLAHHLGLSVVPLLGEGLYNTQSLRKLMGPSRLGSVHAEGIYLRWDDSQWLTARAKVVRPGWMVPSEEHWATRPLKANRVVREAATESKSSP
jgi:ATP-dependent RNA circularization protein (DNA/RNA ligase family)